MISAMRWLLIGLFVVVGPGVAFAQYNVPSQATGSSRVEIASDEDTQVIAKGDEETEIGQEVGASLDFVTRDGAMGQPAYKFTDIVLFRVHSLVAIGRSTEVFTGIDLLPKQPSFTNESKWQTALLGVRYTMNKHYAAYVRAQGGPGIARDGLWVAGEAAVQARMHLAERVLFWESALGAEYTRLFPDDETKIWQTELLAQTGIAIREKHGFFATWLNFGFHFPLVGRPTNPDPRTMREIDPQTRVGVSLGALVGVTRGLDFFLELSILDRGDLANPATTLPILEGGFDQRRIVFGFNRRFGSRRH
jgi:hypothetical protein